MTTDTLSRPASAVRPDVTSFFDDDSNTISHVVRDPTSTACAVIDSVLGFDVVTGRTDKTGADRIIAHIREQGLTVGWVIETHAHADHLSAGPYIQQQLGGKLAIGEGIRAVQDVFGKVFNAGTEFARDGSQFDHLFADGDRYAVGAVDAFVLSTPGHTPACMVHVIGDAAFVGDTLFMPDGGTARCDFPGGDARALYRSIQRVLALPYETRLFMCHDYGPGGRAIAWQTTVADQRAANIHVRDGVSEDEFVAMRTERDRTLKMPRLILPSVQVNMRAGKMPPAEDNGVSYIKTPIDLL